jgi:mannose-6-phosphate isomerase-like protein (cupin superfamily)
VLAEIVTGLACAESLWRPHVAHDADERVRRRLLATPAYEVWLLGWTPRQSVGLHDHGDANGAFVVVDGELVETSVIDAARHDDARRVGDLARVPAGAVHDVANRSRRNATSIHIYSEPLSAMGFYGRHGELVRVEAVHEQSPLVDLAAVERVLHPARGTIRR